TRARNPPPARDRGSHRARRESRAPRPPTRARVSAALGRGRRRRGARRAPRRMLRTDLISALKEGTRTGESRRTSRVRMLLLTTQATLTTVLLVGTGLFVL